MQRRKARDQDHQRAAAAEQPNMEGPLRQTGGRPRTLLRGRERVSTPGQAAHHKSLRELFPTKLRLLHRGDRGGSHAGFCSGLQGRAACDPVGCADAYAWCASAGFPDVRDDSVRDQIYARDDRKVRKWPIVIFR